MLDPFQLHGQGAFLQQAQSHPVLRRRLAGQHCPLPVWSGEIDGALAAGAPAAAGSGDGQARLAQRVQQGLSRLEGERVRP